jgi:predicted PurR-regulated permease PerM
MALGGLVLLCYGLWVAAWLVNTLVLTLLLALVISPVLLALRRRGWPAWAAVVGGFLVVAGIMLVILGLALTSLSQFDENLPFYQQRLTEIVGNLNARFPGAIPQAADLGTVSPDLTQRILRAMVPLAFNVVSLGATLVLYMFLLLYAFGEVFVMPTRLRLMTANDPELMDLLRRFGNDMRSFFTLNAGIGAIAAAADTVVLLVMGVDFALFFGLVAFLLSFIPNIGFVISMAAPAVLALIQFGPVAAVQVILAYCVINVLIDYVLRPRIMGKDLNMSQIVAFLAVMVWGALLGPTGALLCIPLTLIAKLFLEMATRTTQYSALIVEELPGVNEDEPVAITETDGQAAPAINAGGDLAMDVTPDGQVPAAVKPNGRVAAPTETNGELGETEAPAPTKR